MKKKKLELFLQKVPSFILNVLEETKGNISTASKILGIRRMTLYNRLKKYNYTVNKLDA